MHWINFHIKHTAASQCSISCCLDHEKGLSRNFFPIHAEMQSCADTEWKCDGCGFPVRVLVHSGVCVLRSNGLSLFVVPL